MPPKFPSDQAAFRERACPRDHAKLLPEKMRVPGPDVTVDRCPTCAGLFLDKNELLRLTGDATLNKFLRDKVGYDADSGLLCPHCGGIMDLEHAGGVEVEVCLSCYGLWLDKGELDALAGRKNLAPMPLTPEKRQELAKADAARKSTRRPPVLGQYSRALDELVRRYL